LAYDTERETESICAAATGDDALILLLAQNSPLLALAEPAKADEPQSSPAAQSGAAKPHWWQRGLIPKKHDQAPKDGER
jgi:hypothetical protein